MANQSNIMTMEGKMGGISFYKRKGRYVARKAAGPSRASIMSDPDRVRHIAEFSATQKLLKFVMTALVPAERRTKIFVDGDIRTRVQKLLRSILKLSDAPKGERNLRISEHRDMFQNFELNSKTDFKSAFRAEILPGQNPDRRSGSLIVEAFTPANVVTGPDSATHFKLFTGLAAIGDVNYDAATEEHLPVESALHGIEKREYSDYIAIDSVEQTTIDLPVALPGATAVEPNVTVFQTVGIQFFARYGALYEPIRTGVALKIVRAF